MTGQVFCRAVDSDIGTTVERAEQVRRQEGVIGNQQQLVAFAEGGDGSKVGKFQEWIGEGFNKNRFG